MFAILVAFMWSAMQTSVRRRLQAIDRQTRREEKADAIDNEQAIAQLASPEAGGADAEVSNGQAIFEKYNALIATEVAAALEVHRTLSILNLSPYRPAISPSPSASPYNPPPMQPRP